jgi:predicted enzyme related to lactoylglutathione lyase
VVDRRLTRSARRYRAASGAERQPGCEDLPEGHYDQGIPTTTFAVQDVPKEYERLKKLGVVFDMEPTRAGPVLVAVFDDTCGNRIQIHQD